MLTPEIILQEAKNLSDYMIAIRRDIHAHPELGRDEYRTQALVIRELEAMGIEARPIAEIMGVLCTTLFFLHLNKTVIKPLEQ